MNELKVLQLEEIKILDTFVAICQKHDLKYFLIGGTLLGAVRHQGFIPWDDDIDICMPRKDYMRFLNIAEQELNDGLYLSSLYNTANYHYCFSKISNPSVKVINRSANKEKTEDVWIDIIPLDGLPNNKILCFLHKKRIWLLKRICQLIQFNYAVDVRRKRSLPGKVLVKICSFIFSRVHINATKSLLRFDRALMKYDYDSCDMVLNYVACIGFREMFPRAAMGEGKLYPFEDRFYVGPDDGHTVLKNTYGDYMKLPPEDERASHNLEILYQHNPEGVI